MLPDWETNISRQRGRQANINQGYSNRTPYEADKSFYEIEENQTHGRSFLPGINNSRQAGNFRTISHNPNERKHFHGHNRSVLDQPSFTDEKKMPPLPSRSQHHSIERPPPRKNFDGDDASYECKISCPMQSNSDVLYFSDDYQEEPPNIEQDDIPYTPSKVEQQQQQLHRSQFPSSKHYEGSLQRILTNINPQDSKIAKKAYGESLLDQIRANANRRNMERQQRREEDRQLLNQESFFDGFGRSRDRFLNKYHAKLYQVPAAPRENNKIASLTPIPFDKINNSERNYNLNPSANRGLNRSFRQPGTTNITPLRGNRNYAEEKENQRAVNRTLEPYYSNDLNTEEDGEEEGDEFGEKNVGSHLNQQNKVPGFYENERKPTNEFYKHTESQKPSKFQLKHLEVPSYGGGGLIWKPSSDRLTSDADALKNYINKLEYQKILDKQVLEKQLQKEHDQKVREMEDIIEALRLSRERLMKELESSSTTPKGRLAHQKIYKESVSQPPTNRLVKHHHNNMGGAGSPITLQPGDRSNKSLLHNPSSKRTLHENKLSSRRDLHGGLEYEATTLQNNIHEQANAELRKLREELKQNNKRFQEQITDVQKFLKKPSEFSKANLLKELRMKESDSKISLANESRLVPYQTSPMKTEKGSPENNHQIKGNESKFVSIFSTPSKPEKEAADDLQTKAQGLEPQEPGSEKHFTHPKVIHNTLTLQASETLHNTLEKETQRQSPHLQAQEKKIQYGAPAKDIYLFASEREAAHQSSERTVASSNIDKETLDKLLNFAASIENSVKNQNQELRREMSELKQQLARLLEGKGNRSELESLQNRLNQLESDNSGVAMTNKVASSTQNSYLNTKRADYSILQPSMNSEPIKNSDFKNPVSSLSNQQPALSNTSTINNESQKKINHELQSQLKLLHPRDTTNFNLKKSTKGMKRGIRTGEEEFFKKI